MLHRTNLVAFSSGPPRPKYANNTVLIYDDNTKQFILEFTFPAPIKAIRLRKDKYFFKKLFNLQLFTTLITTFRLVVALRKQIHVFSFPEPAQRLMTLETRDNPLGLCELAPLMTAERQLLVFPGHKIGSIQLVVRIIFNSIILYFFPIFTSWLMLKFIFRIWVESKQRPAQVPL